jgi:hypothetical protein
MTIWSYLMPINLSIALYQLNTLKMLFYYHIQAGNAVICSRQHGSLRLINEYRDGLRLIWGCEKPIGLTVE